MSSLVRQLGLDRLTPWHYAVAAGAALGVYLLTRKSGPSLSFSGPAEGFAPLESEAGCDPTEKPGVQAFRRFILANFGGVDDGIVRDCETGGNSGHKLGKAWDWGVLLGNPDVSGMFDFLLGNDAEIFRRAGITYLIWQRQIFNDHNSRVWTPYNGADPHTSHVHFSFGTPGAYGQTSFFQGA